jgi:hypothetical protein
MDILSRQSYANPTIQVTVGARKNSEKTTNFVGDMIPLLKIGLTDWLTNSSNSLGHHVLRA